SFRNEQICITARASSSSMIAYPPILLNSPTSVDEVMRRHPKARQVSLLLGDPPRLLITGTGREHPGILRYIAPRARRPLVPHGLAPAPGQRDHVVGVLLRSISTVQGAVPTLVGVNTDELPEVPQVFLGVRIG